MDCVFGIIEQKVVLSELSLSNIWKRHHSHHVRGHHNLSSRPGGLAYVT